MRGRAACWRPSFSVKEEARLFTTSNRWRNWKCRAQQKKKKGGHGFSQHYKKKKERTFFPAPGRTKKEGRTKGIAGKRGKKRGGGGGGGWSARGRAASQTRYKEKEPLGEHDYAIVMGTAHNNLY